MFVKSVLLLLALGSTYAYFDVLDKTCPMPRLEHGRIRTRQRSRLARFSCLPRYELVGNRYTTCRGGRWDVPPPVCVRPTCRIPELHNGLRMLSHGGAWVIFFCFPGYELVGSSVIYCDGYKWNATAPTCVDAVNLPMLSCDFEEAGLCGWKQDDLHDFDWLRLNSKTPSSFLSTGPSFDHTLGRGEYGHYMYIESTSQAQNDTARLISPIYDSSLTIDGCFSFAYHMYGKTCGGLRVYQKPDDINLRKMLNMQEEEKRNYIIFEQWGNLGDTWFTAVNPLKNISVDFQIVIEGIRGSSYTSDIAIDDVAILRGDNCTAASRTAVTPTPPPSDSCVHRCSIIYVTQQPEVTSCSCSVACLVEQTCCLDYYDVCLFDTVTTEADGFDNATTKSSSEEAPQTQKLVSDKRTVEPISSSTVLRTIPVPITTPRQTKIPKPQPITSPSTPKAPTSSPSTTTVTPADQNTKPKTIITINKQRNNATYKSPIVHSAAPKLTTKPNRFITDIKPIENITTTAKVSTSKNYNISKPIDNLKTIRKAKLEKSIENKTAAKKDIKDIPQSGKHSIALNITVVIVFLAMVTLTVYVVHVGLRSTRVQLALARFRGHRDSDPEVRYLSSDFDENEIN